ncbi:thiamine diphosphokinase [Rhodobaculum claviforme]|uniref:Thiamine diphosphokinase n=1 Tax=Rhodobaculum claviforme TaxID=1549854 RepID=A0A934TLT5_9RHOB|nr:thiamine diphosphokinase [Rhodobaculum claviforme]MBK5927821.1 thiamine diphosphokinase [Rhodobaculum claviforme]
MDRTILQADCGVTLVGGGEVTAAALDAALARAPRLVGVDGGADRALAAGHVPELTIGDLDSLSAAGRAALEPARIVRIAEQDTTDFDKALRSVSAPFVLAVGFTGARIDHMLGAFNVLARHPDRRCVVVGDRDVCFLAPPTLALDLAPGMRMSLFPMGPVRGRSEGLHWPIDGIDFAPDTVTGLSNRVSARGVRLSFSAPRMLVLLPVRALDAALAGLTR